jgi:hypothetical protein
MRVVRPVAGECSRLRSHLANSVTSAERTGGSRVLEEACVRSLRDLLDRRNEFCQRNIHVDQLISGSVCLAKLHKHINVVVAIVRNVENNP